MNEIVGLLLLLLLFFYTKHSKSEMYFILAVHLNLDIPFSSKILDVYFNFIKFAVKKTDSPTHVVPNVLKVFQ